MIQPYDRVAEEFTGHPLRVAEVPVEHYISELLPTMRWSRPAYAGFAAPAAAAPGEPLEVDTPDRWWGIDARNGGLLVYARVFVMAFPESLPEGPVTVQPTSRTLSAVTEGQKLLGELLTAAVPAFFGGESGDSDLRGDLAEVIGQVLPEELMPWYKALVPDFFDWLERR
jgi:hypothetical protein